MSLGDYILSPSLSSLLPIDEQLGGNHDNGGNSPVGRVIDGLGGEDEIVIPILSDLL